MQSLQSLSDNAGRSKGFILFLIVVTLTIIAYNLSGSWKEVHITGKKESLSLATFYRHTGLFVRDSGFGNHESRDTFENSYGKGKRNVIIKVRWREHRYEFDLKPA